MKLLGPEPSANADNKAGWCTGFNTALEMISRNRDHYRALLGAPKMSQEDVLRWIYSKPWRDDATHRTSPRRLDQPSGTPEIGPPAIESIDLYLLPAVTGCEVTADGKIQFKFLEWDKITNR